jgi:hypothetical protein
MKLTSTNQIFIPLLIRSLESFLVTRKARSIFTARTSLFLLSLCVLSAASTVDGWLSFLPVAGENQQIHSLHRRLNKDFAAVVTQENLATGALAQTNPSIPGISLPADKFSRKAFFHPGLPGLHPDSDHFLEFIQKVSDGQAGVPRGVYAQDLFALPIIQQPDSIPLYVSNKFGLATQYSRAAKYGVTGILAHNYLSGESFDQLTIGQTVVIVYGDQTTRLYRVREIHRFQKVEGSEGESEYLNLSNGELLTTAQVFNQFYQGDEHLTFQTCLKGEGIWDWGLIFVIAKPID